MDEIKETCTISELIVKLEEIKQEYGDIHVYIVDDGQVNRIDLDYTISIHEHIALGDKFPKCVLFWE